MFNFLFVLFSFIFFFLFLFLFSSIPCPVMISWSSVYQGGHVPRRESGRSEQGPQAIGGYRKEPHRGGGRVRQRGERYGRRSYGWGQKGVVLSVPSVFRVLMERGYRWRGGTVSHPQRESCRVLLTRVIRPIIGG